MSHSRSLIRSDVSLAWIENRSSGEHSRLLRPPTDVCDRRAAVNAVSRRFDDNPPIVVAPASRAASNMCQSAASYNPLSTTWRLTNAWWPPNALCEGSTRTRSAESQLLISPVVVCSSKGNLNTM